MSYAEHTAVPVGRSRIEIEELLQKHGATSVAVMLDPGLARVAFKIDRWAVLFKMPLPAEDEATKRLLRRSSWRGPSAEQKRSWIDQESRRRWRALLLTIKAKLVSVENAVETFEEAFLAHLVLPGTGGETVADQVLPGLRAGANPFLALPSGEAHR